MSKDDKKQGLFKRLKTIKDKNEEQLQAIKNQGEKQLKELKNIDKSKTLKAIGEISNNNNNNNNKMMKQINYCLNLREQMRQLLMQNSFVRKLMELNMT